MSTGELSVCFCHFSTFVFEHCHSLNLELSTVVHLAGQQVPWTCQHLHWWYGCIYQCPAFTWVIRMQSQVLILVKLCSFKNLTSPEFSSVLNLYEGFINFGKWNIWEHDVDKCGGGRYSCWEYNKPSAYFLIKLKMIGKYVQLHSEANIWKAHSFIVSFM